MENNNSVSCDECEKEAKHNVQETWVHYNIDKDGGYDDGEIQGESGGDNTHLCDEHYKNWKE